MEKEEGAAGMAGAAGVEAETADEAGEDSAAERGRAQGCSGLRDDTARRSGTRVRRRIG